MLEHFPVKYIYDSGTSTKNRNSNFQALALNRFLERRFLSTQDFPE